MKKQVFQIIIALFVFLAMQNSPVMAQGFSALLEKLDKLEARIAELEQAAGGSTDFSAYDERFAELEDQVANIPQSQPDISVLEERLAGLEQANVGSDSDPRLEFIENSIVELSMKVKAMEEAQVTAGTTDQNAGTGSQFAAELRALTTELREIIAQSGEESQADDGLSFGNIELAGFFDLIYLMPDDNEEDKGFVLNQMEVDIESAFSPYVSIVGAIAYGGEAFEVGAAFADLHWMGESSAHPVGSQMFEHSGLMVGQFDVPFGADFERIASPDRSLFSAPLAVSETVDGWNDLGLNLYGGQDLWDAQMYFVNGDQENMAYGGRLTFMLSEYLRVGGSSASILNSEDQPQANFYGGDAVFHYAPVEVTAEYILKQDELQAEQVDIAGYYVEGVLEVHQWFHKDIYLVGGYSAVEHKNVEHSEVEDKLSQITVGAGFNLNENASLRIEYETEDSEHHEAENVVIGQFVVSF